MAFCDRMKADMPQAFPDVTICDFGHIGDGGVHFNLVVPKDSASASDTDFERRLRDWVFAVAVEDFNGSFSAEHAIGRKNQAYYDLYTPTEDQGHGPGPQGHHLAGRSRRGALSDTASEYEDNGSLLIMNIATEAGECRSGNGSASGEARRRQGPLHRWRHGLLLARSRGEQIASLKTVSAAEAAAKIEIRPPHEAFRAWRLVPAPKRGELVRLLGEELRAAKADLGRLVSIEAGKIASEGLGEVQEMIDICDFAVGLSRQLYGLTIATERPGHRMMETWHPLGVIGVISAFNFPVAVWSWNAALALVCGNAVVWKPSEKTPLTALACQAIFERADRPLRRCAGRPVAGADRRPRPSAKCWSIIRRCRWSRRPARPAWAAMSARAWPSASPAPSSNSAATMPASSARRPISTWRCAPSPSAPWAPPASAARRCAACSCMKASTTSSCRA